MTDKDTAGLARELDTVLAELLRAAEGSRCTLRIDDAAHDWKVDYIAAEAVQPGVKSLRGEGSIDQRAADTVKWLAKEGRNLVQPDLVNAPDPAPPAALMSAYAATAQMLAPLHAENGYLQGWISVHFVGGTRDWTPAQIAALDRARTTIAGLLGLPRQ